MTSNNQQTERTRRTLIITLKLAPHVTTAMAKRELCSRVNDGCRYYDRVEQPDVQISKIEEWLA